MKKITKVRRPFVIRFTLADRFQGQRLRADETATALTFTLGYAARRAQEVRR